MSLRERTYYVHGLNGTTGATSGNYRDTRLALLRRRNTRPARLLDIRMKDRNSTRLSGRASLIHVRSIVSKLSQALSLLGEEGMDMLTLVNPRSTNCNLH